MVDIQACSWVNSDGVQRMSIKSLLRCLCFFMASTFVLSACSPEEYGPCSIPNTRAHRAACEPTGEDNVATCRADYVFDCDSLICGIYSGSDPFCTRRCTPTIEECNTKDNPEYCTCPEGKTCVAEGQCPEAASCVEWIKGTSEYYCLPNDKKVTDVKP